MGAFFIPERVRDGVARVAAGEFVRHESEFMLPSGSRTFDFSMKPVLDESGNAAFLVAEGHDITDLKQTEAAFAPSAENGGCRSADWRYRT